jgi:hypothetical protein
MHGECTGKFTAKGAKDAKSGKTCPKKFDSIVFQKSPFLFSHKEAQEAQNGMVFFLCFLCLFVAISLVGYFRQN